MAFFSKRGPTPVERLEGALKDMRAARAKLADRLSVAETAVGEKHTAAEQLAMAGAVDAELDRAEADMRAVEDRVKTFSAALAQLDEQIAATERELTNAKAQRDRGMVAEELEGMASAIAGAAPSYDAAATALIEAVTKSAVSMTEASRFAAGLDQMRRDTDVAVRLICSELLSAAARTRSGKTNIAFRALSEAAPLATQDESAAPLEAAS